MSSTPHRLRGAPEQQRAPSAQRQRPQQSRAERGQQSEALQSSAPSVPRYGAVWPPRRSYRRESLHHPRHNTACSSGGLNQAISLGHLALGQQRKVARAPAGGRNRSVPCGTRPKARRRRARLRNRKAVASTQPSPHGEREKKAGGGRRPKPRHRMQRLGSDTSKLEPLTPAFAGMTSLRLSYAEHLTQRTHPALSAAPRWQSPHGSRPSRRTAPPAPAAG